MRKGLMIAVATLPILSGGCVAKTAFDVVTAPVKVVGKAADWATTSQDESDRNYGRKVREKEEKEGRERKKRDEKCRKDPDDCD
ncbi:hypothetical protein J2Y54_001055 [Sphingomonas sp. BE123]|jgi:hypothetical protein|uniref:hypothetical protein n=1 Tax=unclassified Sphingomonas TaxID=196159 RepID=UPI002856AA7B|nr:hypothetical protein [Sphingomonas sp. BE123]MDR6851562.1 hypothetical protein [Sphingomonas sp. BE123]